MTQLTDEQIADQSLHIGHSDEVVKAIKIYRKIIGFLGGEIDEGHFIVTDTYNSETGESVFKGIYGIAYWADPSTKEERQQSVAALRSVFGNWNGLVPVWVRVYAEAERKGASFLEENKRENWYDRYHSAINTGNISAALTAVSDAISWLKEQKK